MAPDKTLLYSYLREKKKCSKCIFFKNLAFNSKYFPSLNSELFYALIQSEILQMILLQIIQTLNMNDVFLGF